MTKSKLLPGDLHSIGKFFIWCGIIFILILGVLCVYKIKRISSFIPTQAKIIDIKTYTVRRAKYLTTKYVTTVEFNIEKSNENPSGRTYVSEATFHEAKQGEIGNYIPILYEAAYPSNININKFIYLWGYFIFFGSVGLIVVLTGLVVYSKEKKI